MGFLTERTKEYELIYARRAQEKEYREAITAVIKSFRNGEITREQMIAQRKALTDRDDELRDQYKAAMKEIKAEKNKKVNAEKPDIVTNILSDEECAALKRSVGSLNAACMNPSFAKAAAQIALSIEACDEQ